MAITASFLNIVGLILLSHAVYSSYEHSLLPAAAQTSKTSSILPDALDPKFDLPVDIVFETLVSVGLLCSGIVLSSADLKPIRWSVWAGKLERSKSAQEIKAVGVGGGNPYANLEERPGFLQIRAKRQEYLQWAKGGTAGHDAPTKKL